MQYKLSNGEQAFFDSNSDGLVTVEELETAIEQQRVEIKKIEKAQATLSAQLEQEIALAVADIRSGAVADAYKKVKQVNIELQQYNNDAEKKQKSTPYGAGIIVGVIALISIIVFVWVNKKRRK